MDDSLATPSAPSDARSKDEVWLDQSINQFICLPLNLYRYGGSHSNTLLCVYKAFVTTTTYKLIKIQKYEQFMLHVT